MCGGLSWYSVFMFYSPRQAEKMEEEDIWPMKGQSTQLPPIPTPPLHLMHCNTFIMSLGRGSCSGDCASGPISVIHVCKKTGTRAGSTS